MIFKSLLNKIPNIAKYNHTTKSEEAPVVTFSGPNTNSSAALPPIMESILANSCDFVI